MNTRSEKRELISDRVFVSKVETARLTLEEQVPLVTSRSDRRENGRRLERFGVRPETVDKVVIVELVEHGKSSDSLTESSTSEPLAVPNLESDTRSELEEYLSRGG